VFPAKTKDSVYASKAERARGHAFPEEGGLQEPETIDDHFNLIDAFLDGMNSEMFLPNA